MEAWERQDGEPTLWYGRFQQFIGMGPERSLLGIYNQWRREKAEKSAGKYTPASSVPSSWDEAAKKWRWRERADAYDLAQLKAEFADTEKRVLERRKKRLELQDKLLGKIEDAIASVSIDEVGLGAAVYALRILSEQQRIDLNDTPAQRGNESGTPAITNIQFVISGDIAGDESLLR